MPDFLQRRGLCVYGCGKETVEGERRAFQDSAAPTARLHSQEGLLLYSPWGATNLPLGGWGGAACRLWTLIRSWHPPGGRDPPQTCLPWSCPPSNRTASSGSQSPRSVPPAMQIFLL